MDFTQDEIGRYDRSTLQIIPSEICPDEYDIIDTDVGNMIIAMEFMTWSDALGFLFEEAKII
jgi:hypothetical protein